MAGSLRLREADGGRACVVFGVSMPCWLPGLAELGLRAVLVMLRDDTHLDAVEVLVGDECLILCGPDWRVYGTRVPTFGTREVVGLIDGRLTSDIASLARAMGLYALSSTMSLRRSVPGWEGTKVLVDHSLAGGVTTVHPRIHRYDNRDVEYTIGAIPRGLPRDVGTVLSAYASSFHFRKAPLERAVEPLAVVNLGNETHPVYHGGAPTRDHRSPHARLDARCFRSGRQVGCLLSDLHRSVAVQGRFGDTGKDFGRMHTNI
jgi:hypothetical protein